MAQFRIVIFTLQKKSIKKYSPFVLSSTEEYSTG